MSDFLSAARWTDKQHPESHQIAAWNYAWALLTKEQQKEFLELFRASPEQKPSAFVNYDSAIKLIKEFEGCHLSAYPDPLHGWDVATIGYGTTRYSDGRKVQRGDKITVIDADQLLKIEVERIAEKLCATIPFWNAMGANQQSALISFSYNLGAGFYGSAGFETISKRLREKDWRQVPAAMELYRNPGSNVEAGLLRRRKAEGALWAKDSVAAEPETSKLRPSSPFSSRVTPHIRLGEFALDKEERRFQHQYQLDTAAELAAFLERARTAFGNKPIIITSGFRPPAVNRMVNGASSSEHLYSKPKEGAVDFWIDGADMMTVQRWCDKEWPFSLGYAAPKFIHLGRRADGQRRRWDYA